MSNSLTVQGQRLLNHMLSVGIDRDVTIATLHRLSRGCVTSDNKLMQQYVGSIVSRVNRRQGEFKIIPGELKRTYRVTRAKVNA